MIRPSLWELNLFNPDLIIYFVVPAPLENIEL